MTLLATVLGVRDLTRYAGGWGHGLHGFWARGGIDMVVASALVVSWLPPMRRSLRMALALPFVHCVAIAAALCTLRAVLEQVPEMFEHPPLLGISFESVASIGGVAMLVLAAVITVGQRGRWLHALVTLSIVQLLLVGLWSPLACELSAATRTTSRHWSGDEVAALVLVPPALASLVYTSLAFGNRANLRAHRFLLVNALAALGATSLVACLGMSTEGSEVYAETAPLNFAFVAIAAASLAVLAMFTWLGRRRDRRNLTSRAMTGTVHSRVPIVATIEIESWLYGVTASVGAFELDTGESRVPIPPGGKLACVLPLGSMRLPVAGELPIVRDGDRVTVSGLVELPSSSPFRGTAGWATGTSGLTLCRAGDEARCTGIALELWRPCITYLAAVIAICVPALIALGEALAAW